MNLNELDRLHDSATKGEWVTDPEGILSYGPPAKSVIDDENLEYSDAAYIVALHNAYPQLRKRLLAAEKLAEAVATLRPRHHAQDCCGLWEDKRDVALSDYREALK